LKIFSLEAQKINLVNYSYLKAVFITKYQLLLKRMRHLKIRMPYSLMQIMMVIRICMSVMEEKHFHHILQRFMIPFISMRMVNLLNQKMRSNSLKQLVLQSLLLLIMIKMGILTYLLANDLKRIHMECLVLDICYKTTEQDYLQL